MSCECPAAGYCARHKINKSRRLHDLCQKGGKYWDAWEADRGPCQASTKAERKKPKPRGPGSFLAAALKKQGYAVTYKCGCESKIRKMNKWGVDGCRRRLDTICRWIETAAKESGWCWAWTLNTPGIAWLAKREIRAMIVAAIDAAEAEAELFARRSVNDDANVNNQTRDDKEHITEQGCEEEADTLAGVSPAKLPESRD